MGIIDLLRRHGGLIFFGILCAFFSGFGQTFFVGLHVEAIRTDFGLSRSSFGLMYSVATLGSAFLLPWAGSWVDRVGARRFAMVVGVGLSVAAWLFAAVPSVFLLVPALFLLRLFGQGLMSHAGQITTARYFEKGRGKALGISGLGYPLSEALLPPVFAALLVFWGWRGNWLLAGGMIILIFLPITRLYLPERDPSRPVDASNTSDDREDEAIPPAIPRPPVEWTPGRVVRDPRVWLLLPFFVAPPFLMTGFFFHQASVAEAKSWTLEAHARFFFGFAAARIAAILLVGPLIDRLGASRILSYTLFPLTAGLLFLLSPSNLEVIGYPYLALAGFTLGAGGTIKTAYLAEAFGPLHLGGIRSLFASAMVFSTAIAPPLFGQLLDNDVSLKAITAGAILFCVVATIAAVAALRMLSRISEKS